MESNTLVESSFSAIIDAPIEKIDIPAWCFELVRSGIPIVLPSTLFRRCHYGTGWQAHVNQRRSTGWKPDGRALRGGGQQT